MKKFIFLLIVSCFPSFSYASGATDVLSVFDYMSSTQISDVQSNVLLDDTAAINSACNAAVGNKLYFPAGSYLYSGGCTLGNGEVIEGSGRNATIIYAETANASSLFTASGYGSGIEHIGFTDNIAQTGGEYVALSGTESFITDFTMNGDFNGINMTGSVARIRHGRFQNGASGATRIIVSGGDTSQMIDDILMGAQSPQISRAGIEVVNSSALIISNTSVIDQGTALLIDPSTSQLVASLYVDNCFFDYSSGNDLLIDPSGSGSVVRSRFANTWFGDSSENGIEINNSGTGTVAGIHFISPDAILNTGSGLTTSGTVSDIDVTGGIFSANAYGLYFNSGVSDINISGAKIGSGGGAAGNTNYGVVLVSGVSNILIDGNDVIGNSVGSISDGSGAVTKIITNNLGQ